MRKPRLVGVRFAALAMVGAGVVGLIVLALWNWLMPAIFGVSTISFWQALGLFMLCRVLIGGFGYGGSRGRRPRIARGWRDLTPEEQQRFRQAMGPRFPDHFGEGETPEKA